MILVSAMKGLGLSAIGCALALFFSPGAFAQGGAICPERSFSELVAKPTVPSGLNSHFAAKPSHDEEAAYRAFAKLKPGDADKRIKVGEAFVQKYPSGPYAAAVYSGLVNDEYVKQNFAKMEEYADKALALNPDDLKVLVLVGWVIPHGGDPTPAQLAKAEEYEKHVFSQAANAFKACAEIPGSEQARCKQMAVAATKNAGAHEGLSASATP